MEKKLKIVNVVGARPNFMKIAPLLKEMKKHKEIIPILVHTGQHYDYNLSDQLFADLKIPKPDYFLGIGSGSHAEQTAKIMIEFEKVLLAEKPDWVLVVGDVNSTIACGLTAKKMGVKLAHVEAGLRSNNWQMPEEINRVLTDRISDLLFASSDDAVENLLKEGARKDRVFFAGNIMIDSLLQNLDEIRERKAFERFGAKKGSFAVLTMHRAENVDDRKRLEGMLDAIGKIQEKIQIIYPMHPRARKMIESFGLSGMVEGMKNLKITEPLGYIDFLSIVMDCKFVLTDSGGVQEEASVLGIPCLTMRTETERPITVLHGTNRIVGVKKEKIIKEAFKLIKSGKHRKARIKFWDGRTSERIVEKILEAAK